MDFAKKQLEKYGWKEGQGLGKEANGISVALKPKLKFDKYGVGHDCSEQFTNNWWESLYNQASSNLNVKEAMDTVKLKVVDPDAVEISTKGFSVRSSKAKKNGLEYGSFLKTSKLTPSGVIDLGNNYSINNHHCKVPALTDDEIFAACGKRTAHKGARHGIELSGKLSRIENQEKLLLKQLKRISLSDDTNSKLEKKLKKISEHKTRNFLDTVEEDAMVLDLPSGSQCLLGSPVSHKSKKRKKDRRRVSFNETVTEYQTHTTDEETNLIPTADDASQNDSNPNPNTTVVTVRFVQIIERGVDNNGNISSQDLDEGIDCTNFDEVKGSLLEKVKRENKKMKRKLKKLRTKTAIHESINSSKVENNCIKRKLFDDLEECNHEYVQFKKCHYDLSNIKLTKMQRRHMKKQKRIEKQVNDVAESLDQICKI